jgi:O-antigen biosynthesis protein
MRSKIRAVPYLILLAPLDAIVGLVLLLSCLLELCIRIFGSAAGSNAKFPSPDLRAATILIVTWDGKHLLKECLPAVLAAIKHDGGDHQIIVVDNGSTDGTVDFVRARFPQIRILALEQNYGFTEGNNRGVADVRTDIVVLLNNDMVVDREFLGPLLRGFTDPSVFAVTSQIFFADADRRREETGKTRARFSGGLFYLWHDDVVPADEQVDTLPVFWAGGGSCAIDLHKYRAIGGLDGLYRPFYVEDTDLSYQAWKRGWKSLLAPRSRVVHKHRATSQRKFGTRFVENTIRKNQYLFIWKNVTDFPMILQHVLNLPRIHGRALLHQDSGFELRAFIRALAQLPEAVLKRISNLPHYVMSDREILIRSQKT